MAKFSDLELEDGDLKVVNGSLSIITDGDLISTALYRRIRTPLGNYTRTIFQNDTLILLDNLYGNEAYRLLSLDSQLVLERTRDSILNCLRLEERIVVKNVSFEDILLFGIAVNIIYSTIFDMGIEDNIRTINLSS